MVGNGRGALAGELKALKSISIGKGVSQDANKWHLGALGGGDADGSRSAPVSPVMRTARGGGKTKKDGASAANFLAIFRDGDGD